MVALLAWVLPPLFRTLRARHVPCAVFLSPAPDSASDPTLRLQWSPADPLDGVVRLPAQQQFPNGWERLLWGRCLELASANHADLAALPGIGPALAARIVAHRDLPGAGSLPVDDLTRVSGIGPAKLAALRPYFCQPTPVAAAPRPPQPY